jgi:L-rhamnose mutarotase
MIRKAFVMSVNPESHEEYSRRHEHIWEDLRSVLKQHGVHNYSIFLDPTTSKLFAYVEIESEAKWQLIAETESCQRWWKFMNDVMPTNEDGSPISLVLEEVFHLD